MENERKHNSGDFTIIGGTAYPEGKYRPEYNCPIDAKPSLSLALVGPRSSIESARENHGVKFCWETCPNTLCPVYLSEMEGIETNFNTGEIHSNKPLEMLKQWVRNEFPGLETYCRSDSAYEPFEQRIGEVHTVARNVLVQVRDLELPRKLDVSVWAKGRIGRLETAFYENNPKKYAEELRKVLLR